MHMIPAIGEYQLSFHRGMYISFEPGVTLRGYATHGGVS